MTRPPFDLGALFSAIDEERGRRSMSWSALSRQVGVAASTIRRFATATDAEADGVLALVRWLGAAPEDFVASSAATARALPSGEGFVRVDMDAVRAAAANEIPATRTRTTIQHLAEVAAGAELAIADLTRLSEA